MMKAMATIVVLTHNRRDEVLGTLAALSALPGRWPLVVVDNGSNDGTSNAVRQKFPSALLVTAPGNLGAAGRNLGVAQARTPYVALSDDDTRWEPGALERAVSILDAYPRIAVLNACVQVGPDRRPDAACTSMAHSPLPRGDLPGPRLLGFMAGACVLRTEAFWQAGGFWRGFFIGGEEALLALDLAQGAWDMVYAAEVVTRHFPSQIRNTDHRTRLIMRNAIWTAWMRRPWRPAWRITATQLRRAYARRALVATILDTCAGLPAVLARRRTVGAGIENMLRQLENDQLPQLRTRPVSM